MLNINQIPVLNDNYSYLIHDPLSGETAAVDPTLARPILDVLEKNHWHLSYILNTHHHNDHIGGNLELKQETGCQVIAAEADQHRIPGIDRRVSHNDIITLGHHKARVIATPGHTSGHIVYHFADDKLLFCGDTLFAMGCGRLFEGTAVQLWQSLQILKSLHAKTKIYCAHEYTQANGRFALNVEPGNLDLRQRMTKIDRLRARNLPTVPSTIELELATNPFFREDSLDLQKTIGMQGKSPVEIFAQLRRLKDRGFSFEAPPSFHTMKNNYYSAYL